MFSFEIRMLLYRYRLVLMAVACVIVLSMPSFAAGILPWEGSLGAIKDSLTGPVAGIISVLALFGCGGLLAFGGELNEVVKKSIFVVMAIALVVGADVVLKTLFPSSTTTGCVI